MSNPAPGLAAPHNGRTRAASVLALTGILIVPSLYSFHFMSFMDAKLAGTGVAAALLSVLVAPDQALHRGRLLLLAPLAAIVVWAAAVALAGESAFFGGSGDVAAGRYGLVLFAALLILGAAPAHSIQTCVALSAAPVALLAFAQYAGLLRTMFPEFPEYTQPMYSVFGNQDLLGGYAALGLVLGFSLWLERALSGRLAVLLWATAGTALLLSGSRSAWLAALVGASFAAAQSRTQLRRIGAAAAAALALVIGTVAFAPAETWTRLSASFAHADTGYRIRLWIWDGTLRLIGHHPIAGVGLGNFAFFSPKALGEALHQRGPGIHLFNHIHTQHAHSDLLEIAAESGGLGMALFVAFLVLIPRRRSPAWPALAAAFTFSLVNTTLHSPAHALAVLLLAGSLAAPDGVRPHRRAPSRMDRIPLAVAGAVLGLLLPLFTLYPSALHARAQALYEAGDPRAESLYRRVASGYRNRAAAADVATLLANEGRHAEALKMAELAAFGLDTGELHYLRAYLSDRLMLPSAATLYRECLLRWPDHPPAYAGLLRNLDGAERTAVLVEAKRWLDPKDYAALTATPAAEAEPPSIPVRP